MTESSILDHPVTDCGLAKSKRTPEPDAAVGMGVVVIGGASSVACERSVDGEERVSELHEGTRIKHESAIAAQQLLTRISILAAFA